jgi:ribonuclease BN (tRNA processing enzyme)
MAELDVDTLVLTHLIPEPRSDEDRLRYVEDIRGGGFTGTLLVADDLATVELCADPALAPDARGAR